MTFKRCVQLAVLGLSLSCKHGTAPESSTVINVLITPSTLAMKTGETKQLSAKITGPPGITQGVTWRSQDPDVASVSPNGVVTALNEGTAFIRATWTLDPEVYSLATIIVTSAPITESLRQSASSKR
jgi:uncharacterized protein YjdB